jgi:hypothetical protein
MSAAFPTIAHLLSRDWDCNLQGPHSFLRTRKVTVISRTPEIFGFVSCLAGNERRPIFPGGKLGHLFMHVTTFVV